MNKSKKDYAYSVLDIDGEVTDELKAEMESIDGVIKVRVI